VTANHNAANHDAANHDAANSGATRHNVVSLIVHLAPAQADAARAAIAAMPGVEIVAEGDGSRLAVTAIDTPDTMAIDQATAMHRTEGVVAVALVYHAIDDAEAEHPAQPETAHACSCGGSSACQHAEPISTHS
jgi:nitrate reductase NapAB chaperone NapD